MSLTKVATLSVGLFVLFSLVSCEEGKPAIKTVDKYTIVPPPGDCEKTAQDGNVVQIHFKGTLENGTEFFNSYDGDAVLFTLGSGQVIKGLEQGVRGMCAGEKRRLRVPPALAYGSKGIEMVPGGATVEFEVELLAIKDEVDVIDQFHRLDINKDGALDLNEINEVIQGEHFQKMMPMKLDENMRSMMVQTLFTMADKNRDGHLDPSEFTQLSKMGNKAMKKKKTSEEL